MIVLMLKSGCRVAWRGLLVAAAMAGTLGAQERAATLALATSPVAVPSGEWPGGNEQQADSLYRVAREALGSGDYRRAATLFSQVASTTRNRDRAASALYYKAFSLFRAAGLADLRNALSTLDRLNTDNPRAMQADARTLRVRVCGELARRGDERCASEVSATAEGVASASPSAAATAAPRATAQAQGATRCPSEDDEDDERIAALNALLQVDAERAIPILEKVLARRDACSVALRRKAVFLVSQKRDPRSADILLNAAKTDPDKEVRGQALFWLGQTSDDKAADMLVEVLNSSEDHELQEKAIFGLSQHRSDKARAALRSVAGRENAAGNVREQAIFWLGQNRSADNAEFLRGLFARTKDEDIKNKILFSLSQMNGMGNEAWLLDVATGANESTEIRKQALFWAGQSRSVSFADLGALYDKTKDRDLKEQLIFVYSQRRESAAVDRMIEIARTEKDSELRKKAVFWLSQSKDPRVLKFLEDIINK